MKLGNVTRTLIAAIAIFFFVTAPSLAQGSWVAGDRGQRDFSDELQSVVMGLAVSDPTGDTFGVSGEQIDIIDLSADVDSGSLIITLTFAGAVSPPDAFVDNSVSGFIDLDTDQNGLTGDVPWADSLSGSDDSGMGNEFYVDLFSYDSSTGLADVVDDGTELQVGDAVVTFGASSLTASISLVTLANDDGFVNVAAVVGNIENATDKAPNTGAVASGGDNPIDPPDIIGCAKTSTSDTSGCIPSATTACLANNQFEVNADWVTSSGDDGGVAQIHETTDDTVIHHYFDAENLEDMVKVLNGCAINGYFWVFGGGLTDLGVTIDIRNTATGELMTCTNEAGTPFDPIRFTDAFLCNE